LSAALTALKKALKGNAIAAQNQKSSGEKESTQPASNTQKHSKKPGPSRGASSPSTSSQGNGESSKGAATTKPPVAKKAARKKKKKEESGKSDRVMPSISNIDAKDLVLTPVDKWQPPVPKLSYGLDRVLFNPGVYTLQDPRSRVYNFDPYLATIMPITEFDFNALKEYVTSSRDTTLSSIANEYGKKYAGSTSSMTGMLSHFHFLLSAWRPVNPAHVSQNFEIDSKNFTTIVRAPVAIFLKWKDGGYAIDADKQFDTANILSMLGKSMEKLLTLSKEDFEKYRRSNSDQLTDEEKNAAESYHYTTMGDFMMRSQLDAYDDRVCGTGMFDLKTRAVVSIRMDAKEFTRGTGYEIRSRVGQWESYEREYYDMIRSAFLKYSLQVRMGRMDGIFVAFHNTQRIFGFQYISLPEMDLAIHGSQDTSIGDREFKLSLHLLNKVLDKATKKWPERSLRLHFETRKAQTQFMYIFAKPVEEGEIEEVQQAGKAQVETFEREVMGIIRKEANSDAIMEEDDLLDEDAAEQVEQEATSLDVWEDILERVEETLENDESGIDSVRSAIVVALEQSGLLSMESRDTFHEHVDALVDAVTGTYESESTEPAAVTDMSTAEEQPNEPSPVEASTQEPQSTQDQISESQTEKGEPVPDNQPSLKDLVVRLAAKFQSSPLPDEGDSTLGPEAESESSDSLMLRKFENTLVEIIRKSRSLNDTPDMELEQPSSSTASEEAIADPYSTYVSRLTRKSQREASSSTSSEEDSGDSNDELLGMVLTVRNKVNGQYVSQPKGLNNKSSWVVEYAIEEIASPERAKKLYDQVLKRRMKALLHEGPQYEAKRASSWSQMFRNMLHGFSKKGHHFRKKENAKAKLFPLRVYGVDEKLKWKDVFTDEGVAIPGQQQPQPQQQQQQGRK
jgi:hypothetical protein